MDEGNEFLRYDRIWQRVAPGLAPWAASGPVPWDRNNPAADSVTGDGSAADEPDTNDPTARHRPGMGSGPAWRPDNRPAVGPGSSPAVPPDTRPDNRPAVRPGNRPGDRPDTGFCPPFRGTAGPETLADFIQEELAEQRQFQALSRSAPVWARASLRDLAARCGVHARRLMAAYYLLTGERYSPAVSLGEVFPGPWSPALRQRYQAQVCAGLRYAQAAERTGDPCMERLLEELSAEAYKSGADLLRMLERGTGG